MARQRDIINSSVVLLNKDNTPDIFTRDYLHEFEIVPEDAEAKESVHLPQIAKVEFDGAYTFLAQQDRSMIRVDYLEDMEPVDGDKLSKMALALSKATKHMRYHGIGINFRILLPRATFEGIVGNLPKGAIPTELIFRTEKYGFQANLTLRHVEKIVSENGERNNASEEGEKGVLVDSNFHKSLSREANLKTRGSQIEEAINSRNACLTQTLKLIDETRV